MSPATRHTGASLWPTPTSAPKTYTELKCGVEEALLTGQRRVEAAKVLTYFETGRLINAHVLLTGGRASYGSQVLDRLARDLEIARTTLYQCTQFARYFPIVRHGGQLVWAHYRLLCQIEDDAQREKLTALTLKNGWTSPELQERVRALNATAIASNGDPTVKLLTPKSGTPGLHPVVARRDGLAVDLGFKMYLPLAPDEVRRLKLVAGSIVRTGADGKLVRDPSTWLRASDATKADLFTYRALAVRVVDGDTLAVTVDLPPHDEADKKLRLRGINCPEMDTPEGKAVKRFVQNLIDQAKSVVLTTTKPDKYDRYLADIFLELDPSSNSQPSAPDAQLGAAPLFLNNLLLENGQVVPMDGSAPPELL